MTLLITLLIDCTSVETRVMTLLFTLVDGTTVETRVMTLVKHTFDGTVEIHFCHHVTMYHRHHTR